MNSFPTTIFFKSDGSTANLIEEINQKDKDNRRAIYKYQDGFYFKNKTVELLLSTIGKLKKNNLIK